MEEPSLASASRIIRKVLVERGWKLVDDERLFVNRVWSEVAERSLTDPEQRRRALEFAAMQHYASILHAACCEQGSPRQEMAWGEVWNYLFRIANFKLTDRELARDLTQQAVLQAWLNRDRCQPGKFLGYCMVILINEIRGWKRKEKPGQAIDRSDDRPSIMTESEMERPDEADADSELDGLEDPSLGSIDEDLLVEDSERTLAEIVRTCLKKPRQRHVIMASFFGDKKAAEIARELGVSINNVNVLKHRALKTLSQCEAFLQFFEDRLQ